MRAKFRVNALSRDRPSIRLQNWFRSRIRFRVRARTKTKARARAKVRIRAWTNVIIWFIFIK